MINSNLFTSYIYILWLIKEFIKCLIQPMKPVYKVRFTKWNDLISSNWCVIFNRICTWWISDETEVSKVFNSSSTKPRNFKALVAESTVVTVISTNFKNQISVIKFITPKTPDKKMIAQTCMFMSHVSLIILWKSACYYLLQQTLLKTTKMQIKRKVYHWRKRFSRVSQSTFCQWDCHQQPKHGTESLKPPQPW